MAGGSAGEEPHAQGLHAKQSIRTTCSYLRTAIDNYSRPAYTDVLDDETPSAPTRFPTTPRPSQ